MRSCILALFLCLGAAAGAGLMGKGHANDPGKAPATDPPNELLTIRVTIDAWRLFDPERGWFREGPGVDPSDRQKSGANYWTHAAHPARAQIILPDGREVFAATVDFRLFGGRSRMHPQKSFSLTCREKYGAKQIDYPLFGPQSPPTFKYVVARNGGSDWGASYLRDALLTDLLDDPSWELDHQAARPARVFINGEYWGLYHLREKINVHYLAERYGIADKDDIDLLEGRGGAKKGSRRDYDDLTQYIRRHDLADPAAYAETRRRMNVDNFQRLQIANAYYDNRDAGGNLRYWRDRTDANSRWRWILYDVDQGFGLHSDTAYRRNTVEFFTEARGPAWPNPPWSTFLHRKLLANPEYRHGFVNRTLDYLQTDFAPERVLAKIEARAASIAGEIPRQSARWGTDANFWATHLERLREFARHRPGFMREHLREHFDGGPDRAVRLTVPTGGFVVVNDNVSIEGRTYVARYFRNYPLVVVAVADSGYVFAGWVDGVAEAERIVDLERAGERVLQPIFVSASASRFSAPANPPAGGLAPAAAPDSKNRARPVAKEYPGLLGRLSVALLVLAVGIAYVMARRWRE